VTINYAHPTAPVLTISSTDCGRGSTASQRFTVWFNLIRAHPTAPVLSFSSTDCGRGSTASQRFTVWFIVRYRCCRFSENRLGSVGFRGVITNSSWLPSLSIGGVVRAGASGAVSAYSRDALPQLARPLNMRRQPPCRPLPRSKSGVRPCLRHQRAFLSASAQHQARDNRTQLRRGKRPTGACTRVCVLALRSVGLHPCAS